MGSFPKISLEFIESHLLISFISIFYVRRIDICVGAPTVVCKSYYHRFFKTDVLYLDKNKSEVSLETFYLYSSQYRTIPADYILKGNQIRIEFVLKLKLYNCVLIFF